MARKTRSRTAATRMLLRVVVPVLIGFVWIVLRANAFGSTSALLSVGSDRPSYVLIKREIPNVYTFHGNGFDGMPFYVIARSPLNIKKASHYLDPIADPPTYRLRRILFPLAAKAIAPGGGIQLVYAFALLSLAGIGIGGWWLGKFPNAPPWLPLMMAINPGVICALFTSTSDALAAGLVVAAFGAMFGRRLPLAILFLTLAALTRETSLLAGLAFVFWPGLTTKRRVAVAIIPAVPVTAWSIYVAATLHRSFFSQPVGGTFSAPFLGWAHAGTPSGQLALAAVLLVTMVAGTLAAWTRSKPVAIFLGVTVSMYVCAAPIIANQWIGFARVTTPALPLAIWALMARRAPSRSASTATSRRASVLRAE